MVNGPMGGPNVAHLTNQRPVLWAPDQSEASYPPVVRVRASWQHDGVIIISLAAKTRTRMGQTWAVLRLRNKSRDVRFINVIISLLMMVLGIKLNEKKIGVKSFEKDNPIKWPRALWYSFKTVWYISMFNLNMRIFQITTTRCSYITANLYCICVSAFFMFA